MQSEQGAGSSLHPHPSHNTPRRGSGRGGEVLASSPECLAPLPHSPYRLELAGVFLGRRHRRRARSRTAAASSVGAIRRRYRSLTAVDRPRRGPFRARNPGGRGCPD